MLKPNKHACETLLKTQKTQIQRYTHKQRHARFYSTKITLNTSRRHYRLRRDSHVSQTPF